MKQTLWAIAVSKFVTYFQTISARCSTLLPFPIYWLLIPARELYPILKLSSNILILACWCTRNSHQLAKELRMRKKIQTKINFSITNSSRERLLDFLEFSIETKQFLLITKTITSFHSVYHIITSKSSKTYFQSDPNTPLQYLKSFLDNRTSFKTFFGDVFLEFSARKAPRPSTTVD